MTYRRAYIPGVVVQARGLRGPKGDAGDVAYISSALSTYLSNYAETDHIHGGFSGYNILGSSSSNGLTLSVNDPGVAANAVCTVAGGYVSLNVSDANTTISVTGLQPAGAYLTTAAGVIHTHSDYLTGAALVSHSHGDVNLVTVTGSSITQSSASNGLTLGIPQFLTTAAGLNHSHTDAMSISERTNYFYTSNKTFANSTHIHGAMSTASTTGTNIKFTSASSGLILGIPNYITTFVDSGTHTHGTVLGQNLTAISASSGLTLSVVNPVPLANSTKFIQAWELDTNGNTDGTLSSLQGSKLYLAGGSNITLSGDSNTIWFDAGGGGGNLSLGVLNGTYSSTDIVLYDGPQIAFSGKSNITIYTAESSDTIGTYFMFSVADPQGATNSVHVVSDGYLATTVNAGATTLKVTGLGSAAMHGSISSYYLPQSSAANLFLDANSTLLQSTGAYLTTAAGVGHTHGNFVTTATAGTAVVGSYSTNGFTLGVPAFVTVGGGGAQNWSCSTTLGSGITVVTGAATNTLSYGNFITTAPGLSHTHGGTSTASSAGTTFYDLAHTGSIGITSAWNGLSLSIPEFLTTAALSTHIHGTPSVTNINVSSYSNALSLSVPVGSLFFSNVPANNITFGSAAIGSSTTITAIAGGGTGLGVALKGSGTYSQVSGTVAFVNGGGISWDLSANSMHASHNAYVSTSQFGSAVLSAAEPHIRAMGNTASSNKFTSGTVMLSGVNLTINTSSNGASQYLQISAPAMGYLFFSNNATHSWSSSINGMSTSIYAI